MSETRASALRLRSCAAKHLIPRPSTRCAGFLTVMDELIDWPEIERIVSPHYPARRRTDSLDVMLRMYLMSVWFSLEEDEMVKACTDSLSKRAFLGPDLELTGIPDVAMFAAFCAVLKEKGLEEKVLVAIAKGWLKNVPYDCSTPAPVQEAPAESHQPGKVTAA